MNARAVARWCSRVVVAAAVAAAAHGLWITVERSLGVWSLSHLLRHETYPQAQDRIFGRDYMRSIRQIRERVGERETIYLVDAQRVDVGAAYFALHYLSPRRVRWLGTTRSTSLMRLARRLPSPDSWVVVVGEVGERMRLLTRRQLLAADRGAG